MEKATIYAAAQPEFDTFPRLIDALGLKIEKDMTVAIKVDFLQRCPAIVQPLFLALAQRGASPFLTDCSVPFGDALQSEFPVVIRESCYTSRKTTWFPRHRKM